MGAAALSRVEGWADPAPLTVGYWLGSTTGLVLATVLSPAMNAGSYVWSDKLAPRAMGARPVT